MAENKVLRIIGGKVETSIAAGQEGKIEVKNGLEFPLIVEAWSLRYKNGFETSLISVEDSKDAKYVTDVQLCHVGNRNDSAVHRSEHPFTGRVDSNGTITFKLTNKHAATAIDAGDVSVALFGYYER